MRGRSLIRESSGPSLCAFCAHRLGQTRKPSNSQLRFLQYSRSISKPPGEAAAVRNDFLSSNLQASWGSDIKFQPTWGKTEERGSEDLPRTQPSRSKISFSVDDLLPHEILARNRMVSKISHDQEDQKRPLLKPLPNPQLTRAGRPEPFSDEIKSRIAARKLQEQRVHDERERQRYAARDRSASNSGFRILRVSSAQPQRDSRSSETGEAKDTGTEVQWKQLRRKERSPQSQLSPSRSAELIAGRSKREEEARSQKYTPLTADFAYRKVSSIKPTRPSGFSRSEDSQMGNLHGSRGSNDILSQQLQFRRQDLQNKSTFWEENKPKPLTSDLLATSLADVEPKSSLGQVVEGPTVPEEDRTIVSFRPNFSRIAPSPEKHVQRGSRPSDKLIYNAEPTVKYPWVGSVIKEKEESGGRQKKEKKRRGGDESSYLNGKRFFGKDKDKSRREAQFLRDEAEGKEARARQEEKLKRQQEKAAKKAALRSAPTPLLLPEYITIANLAVALKVRYEELATKMTELGFEETAADVILNSENSGLIAMEYNFEPLVDRGEDEDLRAREPHPNPSELPPRPPVVTIMGHVDHGKTTLLDYLRKSSIAANEYGGITQHIGAFSVPMPGGKTITFLDTPGHAAFLSMRQRGANVTDIVILVVAADDSVKPQTIEAINHAKAANVPMIVAINKIDKPEVDIESVKLDLGRNGVELEDFGGDTQVVCVSGKTGQGMGELEETVVALSEILDMRAEPDGPAEGWVLEASVKAAGKVATVLVRRGTVCPGDTIVAGKTWAKIRVLRNEANLEIDEAGPGTPVKVDGWRDQPLAGDEVLQAEDEAQAKRAIEYRIEKEERDKLAKDMEAINNIREETRQLREEERAARELAVQEKVSGKGWSFSKPQRDVKGGGPREIHFILKADVSGSVEAVRDQIDQLGTSEVEAVIIRSGVGQISEFDIEHAAAAQGHVINFNTIADPHIARLAEESKVQIISNNIIYALIDDVKAELSKYLPPLIKHKVLGEAEVIKIFSINIRGRQHKSVAGCKVRTGTIKKNGKVRVLRRGEIIFDGELSSLKNGKKDVFDTTRGSECGMGFGEWIDFEVGDQIQAYEEKHEKRYL